MTQYSIVDHAIALGAYLAVLYVLCNAVMYGGYGVLWVGWKVYLAVTGGSCG